MFTCKQNGTQYGYLKWNYDHITNNLKTYVHELRWSQHINLWENTDMTRFSIFFIKYQMSKQTQLKLYLYYSFGLLLCKPHDQQTGYRGTVEYPGREAEEVDELADITDTNHCQRYTTLKLTSNQSEPFIDNYFKRYKILKITDYGTCFVISEVRIQRSMSDV